MENGANTWKQVLLSMIINEFLDYLDLRLVVESTENKAVCVFRSCICI
jgi:hypothetical protein